MKRTVVSLLAGISFAFASAAHATLEQGLNAYRKGDYVAALQAWQPLATKGNPDAQNNLGVLYEKGQGVERNFVESVNWYRRAADQVT